MNAQQSRLFTHVLRTSGCLRAALRACGLDPCAKPGLRRRRRKRPEVRTGKDFDLEKAAAVLESEAVRRALDGVELPVFHQGRECGSTVKHSDQLLMFLLKTLRPERYGAARDTPTPEARPLELDFDLSAAGQDDTTS